VYRDGADGLSKLSIVHTQRLRQMSYSPNLIFMVIFTSNQLY